MKLNISPLSQRDPNWSRKTLGTKGTIGAYGCLLTCHSMMLTYYGHELLPDVLNEIYKNKNVYDQGNLINFYAAANCFDDIIAKDRPIYLNVPADLTKIDKQLENKHPVIAHVDNVNNDNVPDHFVLIIGKTDDGHYIINDPWTGETYYFDAKYGDPARYIYGLRIYEGTPKNGENIEDKLSDVTDKLESCNKAVAEKSLEVNTIRTDLETQERDNEDLSKQLLKARGKRDKEAWAKEKLVAENKTLKESVEKLKKGRDTLQGENKHLRSDLKKAKTMSVSDLTKWELFKITVTRLFTKTPKK